MGREILRYAQDDSVWITDIMTLEILRYAQDDRTGFDGYDSYASFRMTGPTLNSKIQNRGATALD